MLKYVLSNQIIYTRSPKMVYKNVFTMPYSKALYYSLQISIDFLIKKKKTKCQTLNNGLKEYQLIYRCKHIPLLFIIIKNMSKLQSRSKAVDEKK